MFIHVPPGVRALAMDVNRTVGGQRIAGFKVHHCGSPGVRSGPPTRRATGRTVQTPAAADPVNAKNATHPADL